MSFISCQSFWRFSRAVSHNNRYIFDDDTNKFLDEIIKSSSSRESSIKSGSIFWRSQIGGSTRPVYDDNGNEVADKTCPHPEERMHPLKYMASEGRANPKGIPFLYLATSKETAMSEVRPWVGSEISVAQFKVKKDLKVIDCSVNHSSNPFFFNAKKGLYEPNKKEREKAVWTHIDRAFSNPVIQNENQAHYVPTQIIAELFKDNGFDGIIYKSLLGEGHNIALFDITSAEMLNCFLYEAKSVLFEFDQIANPYFLRKKTKM